MVRTIHAIGWLLAVALASSGCFGAQAKAILELPPLDMPAPPPRQVEASEPQMPPPVSLPGEPEHSAPSQQQPPPAQRAEAPRAAEPPKAAVEPPKADEAPRPSTTPPSTLQTTPAQREGQVEQRIRTQLTQASNDLRRINYQTMSSDARTQYDTAKRFVTQAEEALRAKNLVFANNLAGKAAALAVQLLSR